METSTVLWWLWRSRTETWKIGFNSCIVKYRERSTGFTQSRGPWKTAGRRQDAQMLCIKRLSWLRRGFDA
jgi:hypothetical protein